jgi:hypothetical protein
MDDELSAVADRLVGGAIAVTTGANTVIDSDAVDGVTV